VDAPSGTRPLGTTLEDLMEQYVDGSSEAFDDLYRCVAFKLFAYLLRLTQNRERVEDLL